MPFFDAPRRLRQPDVTRGKLLQAAFLEIYRHGFQAASLDAILAGAGVTKGALYHHFPSKAALGHAVVSEVITGFLVERWSGTLPERPADPLSALQDVFRHRAAEASPSEAELGCPLNNIAQEMSPLDAEFRRLIDAAYERWVELFAGALEAGRQAGTVRPDADPGRVATLLVSAIEGSYSLAKGQGDLTVLQSNLGMLVDYLEGLRPEG
jgi:AcrR family transcriptional regulator